MKLLNLVFLSLLLLGCSEKDPAELFSNEVFNTLKSNDLDKYHSLLINDADIELFKKKLSDEITNKNIATHESKKIFKSFNKKFGSVISKSSRDFKKIKEQLSLIKGFEQAKISKVEVIPKKDRSAVPLITVSDLKKIKVEFEIDHKTYKLQIFALNTPSGFKNTGDLKWYGLVKDSHFEKLLNERLSLKSDFSDLGCASLDERYFYYSNKRLGYETGECAFINIGSGKEVIISELGNYSKKIEISPVDFVKISYGNPTVEAWVKADKLFKVTDIKKYL